MRLLLALFCAGAELWGQARIQESASGAVVLNQNDLSVLESREPRKDIGGCEVRPRKAELGFDLRLRAGYDVGVMLDGNHASELMVIARVRPLNEKSGVRPLHLFQVIRVPEGDSDKPISGSFGGAFLVGEGKYAVDLLVRDRAGQYCADFWEFEANAPGRENEVATRLKPGEIEPVPDSFSEEPPRQAANGVAVKVLVNYEPEKRDELLGMVRAIARDPRVGSVSLAVFNLEQRKVLAKQERVDFPALKQALEGFQTGLVDAKVLSGEDGGVAHFLASLVDAPELGTADTVIFLGPSSAVDERLSAEWQSNGNRMYYLRYHPNPWQTAWTDSIERAVESARGKKYAIQQPKDMLSALADIVQGLRASTR